MTRVKGANRRRGVPTTRQRIRSRGYDANGSLYDSGHDWLAGALARASLPGPARFLADGKNGTALLSAQGLPGGTVAGFRCSGGTGCATVPASTGHIHSPQASTTAPRRCGGSPTTRLGSASPRSSSPANPAAAPRLTSSARLIPGSPSRPGTPRGFRISGDRDPSPRPCAGKIDPGVADVLTPASGHDRSDAANLLTR